MQRWTPSHCQAGSGTPPCPAHQRPTHSSAHGDSPPQPPKNHPIGAGGPGSSSTPADICPREALARRQERVLFSPCRQPKRSPRFPGIRIQGCREEGALIIANYCSRADSTRVSSAAPGPPPALLHLPTDPRQPLASPAPACPRSTGLQHCVQGIIHTPAPTLRGERLTGHKGCTPEPGAWLRGASPART